MVQFSLIKSEPKVLEEDLNVAESDSSGCVSPPLKLHLTFVM